MQFVRVIPNSQNCRIAPGGVNLSQRQSVTVGTRSERIVITPPDAMAAMRQTVLLHRYVWQCELTVNIDRPTLGDNFRSKLQ